MQFIKCKECETILAIKDLKQPYTAELLTEINEENTVRGSDLCAECAAQHEAERKAQELAALEIEEENGGGDVEN